MEEFISEIYSYSFVLDNLEEFVDLSDAGQINNARSLYNNTMSMLENLLNVIAEKDVVTANRIQSAALRIKESYDDTSYAKGLVLGELIPELYEFIRNTNVIDVTDGKYTLLSSDAGFLTLRDNEKKMYIHDSHNPMREAYRIVRSRYRPKMEHFLIFGVGLSYVAYQVFHQSAGAVKIYIYEDDECLLEFASCYGVLSLIPKDNIEVIHNKDKKMLASSFLEKMKEEVSQGIYFAPYKKPYYDGICDGELNRIILNHEFETEIKSLYIVNLWKNKKSSHIELSTARDRFSYDEWIVISAGPSLNESIPFLKENKGKKGIIAVNTVLRRLFEEGIKPDVVAAADPSLSLENHINGIEDMTEGLLLIADWVMSWKYVHLFKGDICFVRTNASADLTRDFSDEDVWDISGTVSCLGIEAAINLGASKIWLVGQDLAYPDGRRYAEGMPHPESEDTKWGMKVPSVNGGMVDTCEAFVWFRKAIEYQISKYDNVEFINMSNIGAYIRGTHKKTCGK